MRRRDFVQGFAVSAAWPLAALAQQSERMRKVGVLLSPREDDSDAQGRVKILRKGLAELGWTEGHNIHFEYRWTGGDAARAKGYAAELVRLSPDVIVANSTLCLKAVRNETSTIPIVFLVVGDPVGQGFVSSLEHPGGNTTGFTAFEFEIGAKWLELVKEMAPDIRRVVFMFNPDAGLPYADKFAQSIAAAAPARGVELVVKPIHNATEIERAIAEAASETKSGAIVNPDAFTVVNRGIIVSLMAHYRLPAVYAYRYYAAEGGLLAYGHTYNDLWQRAAVYIDKIFKGANPGALPVQNPTKFELIINQKTARALGLTVPDKLLALADEVIE
jgi:putative ABC transport system substrate-binding protein